MFDAIRKGAPARRRRIERITGAAAIVVAAATGVSMHALSTHSASSNYLGITLDLPYAGDGVHPGTAILVRGVTVGQVSQLRSASSGRALISLELDRTRSKSITDNFKVDFRPNYFGVTTVDLSPESGGAPLRPGDVLIRDVARNATLSVLLSRSSDLTMSVLTQKMITVFDRAGAYGPAAAASVGAGFSVGRSLSDMENQELTGLLRSLAQLSAPAPMLMNELITMFSQITESKIFARDKQFWDRTTRTLDLVTTSVFPPLGRLLASRQGELQPAADLAVDLLKFLGWGITEVDMPNRVATLMTALENAYRGPNGSRALNLRISLDHLPAVAAPLSIPGVS